MSGPHATPRYRFRDLLLDSALALAYVLGLLSAFSGFARLAGAGILPWHPYSTVAPEWLAVVLSLEGVLAVTPLAVLIVIGIKAVSDKHLFIRIASVTGIPLAMNINSMVGAYPLVGPPDAARLISALLPTAIPMLLGLFWGRGRAASHA